MRRGEIDARLLSVIDEAGRAVEGDFLFEDEERKTYRVKEREKREVACRACPLHLQRSSAFEEPILKKNGLLFIVDRPSTFSLFMRKEEDFFKKWISVLGLNEEDYSLTSIIKCPAGSFEKSYADLCKARLQSDMKKGAYRAYIILGEEAASYMTGGRLSFGELRKASKRINGVPSYFTYHPRDLVRNYDALRRNIYEDLINIKEALT